MYLCSMQFDMWLGESISTFQPSRWGEESMVLNSSARLSSERTLESAVPGQAHEYIVISRVLLFAGTTYVS